MTKKKKKYSVEELIRAQRQLKKLLTTAKKDLAETNKAFLRGQDDLHEKRRESNERLGRLERAQNRIGELEGEREEMLREYYDLGRCLSATREKWLESEEKRGSGTKAFTVRVETRVADGCDVGSPVGGKPSGSGRWIKEEL